MKSLQQLDEMEFVRFHGFFQEMVIPMREKNRP